MQIFNPFHLNPNLFFFCLSDPPPLKDSLIRDFFFLTWIQEGREYLVFFYHEILHLCLAFTKYI